MNSNDLITKLSKLKVWRLGDQRAPHKPLLLLLALSHIQQEATHLQKIIRDPKFRGKVLHDYNYCCAICGFDVSMGHTPIAPEAAHIKWFQAVGEDTEKNGLALCSLHHKLLDRGALAISKEFTVMVSEKANGYIGFKKWLLDFEGKELRMPQKEVYMPDVRFVEWHVREVFQREYPYGT